jgi:hypothetical protein
MSISGLVVLEGKWSKTDNISVKSLFDVMIDMNFDSPHGYYFNSFANAGSLKDILNDICGQHSRKKYLYVGAHGDESNIFGSVKPITRTVFRNSLRELGGQIRGVFLGSCLFGHTYNAEFLFDDGVPSTVTWIAGYGEAVDWVESAVLDLLFWHTLFRLEKRKKKATKIDLIEQVCKQISKDAPGLAAKWKFQVFVRRQGPGTEPRGLINYPATND